MKTFASLGVHKNLVEALLDNGIESPFPIQEATLPEAIAGRDVLGRGQTGSGKTLAFGLTVLTRLAFEKGTPGAPYALILAPESVEIFRFLIGAKLSRSKISSIRFRK